jgi:predicted metalloprotease with PDZ domain
MYRLKSSSFTILVSFSLTYCELIVTVFPESPGAEAGIRSGDVILKLDGAEISDVVMLRDKVRSLKEGDRLLIELLRRGKITRIQVTVPAWMPNRSPGEIRAPKSLHRLDMAGISVGK